MIPRGERLHTPTPSEEGMRLVDAAPWYTIGKMPPILNNDALDLQPWGHGVSVLPRHSIRAGAIVASLECWQGE